MKNNLAYVYSFNINNLFFRTDGIIINWEYNYIPIYTQVSRQYKKYILQYVPNDQSPVIWRDEDIDKNKI